jgi:hypothetical protein
MDVYRPTSFEDEDEFRPFRGNVYKTKVKNSDGSIADKADGIDYDVSGIKDYMTKFERSMDGRSNPEESTLISNVSAGVNDAEQLVKDDKAKDANQKIQETIDNLIKNSDLTISSMMLKGFSDNITETPGNLRYRDVTIEENIDRRNYREADNIDYEDGDVASSIYYEEPDKEGPLMYDWGKTTLISDRARVYKGGAWDDRAYYIQPSTRRFLDEREATATIGFRCAMTRVGSPSGMGSSKHK